MVCCVIHGCSNSSNKNPGVSFHAIPTVRKFEGKETEELSQRRRDLWLARINRLNFQPTAHSKVCSHHFATGNVRDICLTAKSVVPINLSQL